MNYFEIFGKHTEYSPKLVTNTTIAWFVNEALQKPHFVDAGEWMIQTMIDNNIICRVNEQKKQYSLCNRVTKAKKLAKEKIPQMLRALYWCLEEPTSDSIRLPEACKLSSEQVVSIIMAFDSLVI